LCFLVFLYSRFLFLVSCDSYPPNAMTEANNDAATAAKCE